MLRIFSRFTVTAGVVLAIGLASTTQSYAFWGGQQCGNASRTGACTDTCGADGCATGNCNAGACGARGGTGSELYQYLETGRQANAMWPYPYVCPDRIRAHAPFDSMVNNGWRRQNLLGRHHFDADTGKLTRAGELKVRWILTQTPPNRRQIFIERGIEASITDQRIAYAQEYASGLALDGTEASVVDTHIVSEGRPAGVVDRERSLYIDNRFPPIDFFLEASTTSAGSN